MAITVKLYSFAKRENSTKQPVVSGTDYSCVLLDDTSLMNPTFKLSIAANPIGNNYAYVSDFNRYYFINDISSYQGFWYISCTCDVLASFKTDIGAETHYVLRSASSYDTYITDTMYPAKPDAVGALSHLGSGHSDPLDWDLGHSYILAVVSDNPTADDTAQVGSIVYYHMDDTVLATYMNWIMSDVENWSDLTGEYSPGVQQALLNPMQYIISCQAVPVAPPASLVVSQINFGYYAATIDSGGLDVLEVDDDDTPDHSPFLRHESFSIDLPKHPQASTRGDYLNGDPYSTYTLHFGPFGDIPLDPGALIDCDAVAGHMEMDLITGIGRLIVYGDDNSGAILYNGTAKISVDINLSQLSANSMSSRNKYWSEMMKTMSAVASTNPISGAMKAIEGGMAMTETAAAYRFPTVSGQGTTGSFLAFFDPENIYVTAKFIELVDENLAEFGRPLYQPKQINTLSGYILCQNADCQLGCTADEAVKINGYLNGGFFYE